MAYNLLIPYQFITAQSLGATYTSSPIETKLQDNIGIQLNWTGTPSGTFTVQVSMDHAQDAQGNVTNAGNWVTLVFTPAITASGSADSAYIDLNQLSTPYVRVVYTRSGSTGTLNGYITAKGV